PAIDRDRRNGGAAAVEDDDVGTPRGCELRSLEDVGREGRAREAAARAAAADRYDPRERRRLEVVRSGVPAASRQLDELGHGRRRLDRLRVRGPAATHRDDDDLVLAREQPCDVTGDRRLADALTRPDDGERRKWKGVVRGRVEAKVRPDV